MDDYSLLFATSLAISGMIIGFFASGFRKYIPAAAVAINSLPFAFVESISQNNARIAGIPFGYIPMACLALPVIVHAAIAVIKYGLDGVLASLGRRPLYSMVVFVGYCLFSIVLRDPANDTWLYLFAWIANFVLFLAFYLYAQSLTADQVDTMLLWLVVCMAVGSLVGVLRYIFGLAIDSNFFPLLNRNLTVLFLCCQVPIVGILYRRKRLSIVKSSFIVISFIVGAIFIASRTGAIILLLGLALTVAYSNERGRLELSRNLIYSVVVMAAMIFIFAQFQLGGRFGYFEDAVSSVLGGGPVLMRGEGDFDRVFLIEKGILLIEQNPLFGVGIGLSNYQSALAAVDPYMFRFSRSHNFYVSYLAELGVIGFGTLLMVISYVGRLMSKDCFGKVIFIMFIINLIFNEYILMPELWVLFGLVSSIPSVYASSFHFVAEQTVQS